MSFLVKLNRVVLFFLVICLVIVPLSSTPFQTDSEHSPIHPYVVSVFPNTHSCTVRMHVMEVVHIQERLTVLRIRIHKTI